jgi:hypothetical protein
MNRVIIASGILWLASVACCSILEMGDSGREIVFADANRQPLPAGLEKKTLD